MSNRKDDPVVMEKMRRWLQIASELAAVDPKIIVELEGDLLKMTAHTAHELSRPGTPLTAFIAGLGAGLAAGEQKAQGATDLNSGVVNFTREYVDKVMGFESVPDQSDAGNKA
ncbi:MAG: DUF6457 domain-containing protein [Actinomycetaceae bacterium]|nr:DUF6457 domain-containing protein [Actinomycetaceae bacterium]